MNRLFIISIIFLILIGCGSEEPQQAQAVVGLQKIAIQNKDDVDRLREAGAEIIVEEDDYVIVRAKNMVQAQKLGGEPIEESDLVQRLIRVTPGKSGDLQKAVDVGIDLWKVKGDTLIARAFDIYIEKLRKQGFEVEILARDASKWEGGQ